MTTSKTPLLDTLQTPKDLRKLKPADLKQVADELRHETIDAVSVTGGHLGAGFGTAKVDDPFGRSIYGDTVRLPKALAGVQGSKSEPVTESGEQWLASSYAASRPSSGAAADAAFAGAS